MVYIARQMLHARLWYNHLWKGMIILKLDYDLIRDLLIETEEMTDGINSYMFNNYCLSFKDVEKIKLRYHLKYLYNIGFIESLSKCNSANIERLAIIDITPAGREYLDNIRNISVWHKTKSIIHKFGSPVTVSMVSNIAASVVKHSLGLG